MTVELINILKLEELRILCDKDTILMILKTELQSTSLNMNHAERTEFRKINNMIE